MSYSFWDGSGHRRKLTVRKGDTIETFLRAVRDQVPALRPAVFQSGASLKSIVALRRSMQMAAKVAFRCHAVITRLQGAARRGCLRPDVRQGGAYGVYPASGQMQNGNAKDVFTGRDNAVLGTAVPKLAACRIF